MIASTTDHTDFNCDHFRHFSLKIISDITKTGILVDLDHDRMTLNDRLYPSEGF